MRVGIRDVGLGVSCRHKFTGLLPPNPPISNFGSGMACFVAQCPDPKLGRQHMSLRKV